MKNIKITTVLILTFFTIIFTSCSSDDNSEPETNPDTINIEDAKLTGFPLLAITPVSLEIIDPTIVNNEETEFGEINIIIPRTTSLDGIASAITSNELNLSEFGILPGNSTLLNYETQSYVHTIVNVLDESEELLHYTVNIDRETILTSTIPNGGFDDWTTVTNGTTYEYPEGDWKENLLNIVTRFARQGGFFEKYDEPDANGNAMLVRRNPGSLNDGFIRFESNSVPLKLKGRYKFSQSNDITDTDTLRVRVHFSKMSDTISKINLFNSFLIHPNTKEFETTIKQTDFTNFEIDLEDIATNGEHYDYAVIRLMIKGGSQYVYTASTAVFDDLEFEYDDTY